MVVFDIETVGENWNEIDEYSQSVLTRWVDRTVKNTDEKTAKLLDIKNNLGFSPLTGFVVSIAVYDVENDAGYVFYQADEHSVYMQDGVHFSTGTEAEILSDFWTLVKGKSIFITFNGRAFDVPFLLHRSIACEVMPTAHLLGNRYLSYQTPPYHIDLQDELTFYGVMSKRPNLHLFCRAFGIESSKDETVSGDMVADLFQAKRYAEIARYNYNDVLATRALFLKWKTFLAKQEVLAKLGC